MEREPTLIPAVVLNLREPRLAQAVLKAANDVCPLPPDFQFLKRIRRANVSPNRDHQPPPPVLQVLLLVGPSLTAALQAAGKCHAGDLTDEELATALHPFLQKVEAQQNSSNGVTTASDERAFAVVSVPSCCPRQQCAHWITFNSVWPYAMPKPSPLLPPTERMTEESTRWMTSCVLPMARRAAERGLLGIAAIVIDPETQRVLASSEAFPGMTLDSTFACLPYGVTAQPSNGAALICMDHPITYVLKELAVRREKPHPVAASGSGRQLDQSKPYLANSLHVYVSHEPCVMCAMALVHSRIECVFYCYPNQSNGGAGSCYAVHAIPSLNHHYRAYQCTAAAGSAEDPLTGRVTRFPCTAAHPPS